MLDHVWEPWHPDAFNRLGLKSRLLFTTRIGEVITDLDAELTPIDQRSEEKSKILLARRADQSSDDFPIDVFYVMKECGYFLLTISRVERLSERRKINLA
jgi:hypothetical protein